ncbi:ATP-binding protein [bacterium]|nr:ATP-binding protein [bacterium]
MKEQPFYFGTVVNRRVFLNRKAELKRLSTNIEHGVNTVVISPRRWGKTSLVHKATDSFSKGEVIFVFLDLFRVASRKQFFEHYASAVLKATETKSDELIRSIQTFFSKLIPELSLSPDPNAELSFKLSWRDDEVPESEILELPQKLAEEKGKTIVMCIDEFQNLADFDKDYELQKLLRSHWQHHSAVNYILYGSKRSLMNRFFTEQNLPFYGFGDLMFLSKIEKKEWTSYIQKRFLLFNKSVDENVAEEIADLMDCHSYYVQQLAYVTFLNCDRHAGKKELDQAVEIMLYQNQILYRKIIDDLSAHQIEYLRALTEGVTQFYKKKNLKNYNLGSIGNIKRIKEALEQKEVLDYFEGNPLFLDPGFALWFRKWYLK